MARRRMIDPSIWDDEDVGRLSDGAFRIFVACISTADDDGKLEGSAARLKGIAFRFRNVPLLRIERYCVELTGRLRSVVRYAINGREYIKLLNWDKYQTIRADRHTESHLPDPPTAVNNPIPTDKVGEEGSHGSPMTVPGQSEGSPMPAEVRREGSNKEVSKEGGNPPTPPDISPNKPAYDAYLQHINAGGIDKITQDKINAAVRVYGLPAVLGAMVRASGRSKRHWTYVIGILEHAKEEGTLDELRRNKRTAEDLSIYDRPMDLSTVRDLDE